MQGFTLNPKWLCSILHNPFKLKPVTTVVHFLVVSV